MATPLRENALLEWLLDELPEVFEKEVLPWLDPTDIGMLGRTGSEVRTAVKASNLPRAGTSKEIPLKFSAFCGSVERLMWAVLHFQSSRATGDHLVEGRIRLVSDCRTCAFAARGGRLEVLQWARAHGCWWDQTRCRMAAQAGNLEMLKWARERGCPCDEMTCASAALGGRLEVLQWAREQGCRWDEMTCSYAAAGGKLESVEVGAGAPLPVE